MLEASLVPSIHAMRADPVDVTCGHSITGVLYCVPNARKPQSRLTAQGQISVPARVREGLGLSAGSVLEWSTAGEVVTVRRAGRNTSEDVHAAMFGRRPRAKTLAELKEGIARHMRARHARD